jgi:hypothetical protein
MFCCHPSQMDTVSSDSDDSYEPSWTTYEPDWEDLEYERYKEAQFQFLLQEHDDLDRGLCDHSRPDRQLRNMNKERNSIACTLHRRWQFDVRTDTFEVLDDDLNHLCDIPREGGPRQYQFACPECPRPVSRRDKRRKKTEQRRQVRQLEVWRAQWEKSRAASVVRKTGAFVSAVAA